MILDVNFFNLDSLKTVMKLSITQLFMSYAILDNLITQMYFAKQSIDMIFSINIPKYA